MKKEKCVKAEINADGRQVSILSLGKNNDYISLTDIARYKSDDPNDVIKNWMRGKDVIQFLGLWEKLNNPDFKPDRKSTRLNSSHPSSSRMPSSA